MIYPGDDNCEGIGYPVPVANKDCAVWLEVPSKDQGAGFYMAAMSVLPERACQVNATLYTSHGNKPVCSAATRGGAMDYVDHQCQNMNGGSMQVGPCPQPQN